MYFAEKSENAGDAFLDELTYRGFRVVDLMKHLQGEKFSNFLEIIRLDLGMYRIKTTFDNVKCLPFFFYKLLGPLSYSGDLLLLQLVSTKCIRRRPLPCVMRHESCYNIEHF